MLLLVLAALAVAAPAPGVVVVEGDRWKNLEARAEAVAVDRRPAGARVVSREVRLENVDGQLEVQASWVLTEQAPGLLRVAGPGLTVRSVSVDGRRVPVRDHAGASWVDVEEGARTLTLVGLASLPASLDLLAAAEGRITGPGLKIRSSAPVARVGEAWWSSAQTLSVSVAPPPVADRGSLVRMSSRTGLTVGDGEVRGAARVSFVALRGRVDTLRFSARHVGSDAVVTGRGVREVVRQGSQFTVTLETPVTAASVSLSWSTALGTGEQLSVEVPVLATADGLPGASTLLVARDGDLVVAADPAGGRGLPLTEGVRAAGDLVTGDPVAAWTQATGGSLRLLRFVPAEQPAVIVDVADWWVSLAPSGRALLRGVLTLRNERAAWLRLTLQPGDRLLAVTADGEPARVVRDGADVLVPIPRSVETVEGPLAFPVELALLRAAPLGADRRVDLRLVGVHAEVAVRRTRLGLTGGLVPSALPRAAVDDFTEGATLAYGFGAGTDEAEAEAAFRDAVQAWLDNRFDEAQGKLDALADKGFDNSNVARLQSNLDLVDGKGDDTVASRRVRAVARSRAADEERKQAEALAEADQRFEQGDYEGAERLYEESLSLSKTLEAVEDEESVEQEVVRRSVAVKLEKSKARKRVAKAAAPRAPEPEEAQTESTAVGQVLTKDFLQSIPPGRSYQQDPPLTADVSAGGTPYIGGSASNENTYSLGVRGAGVGGGASAVAGDTAEMPAVLAPSAPSADAGPSVAAVSNTIVMPTPDTTVRVQELLLPPGANPILHLRVRPLSRRTR